MDHPDKKPCAYDAIHVKQVDLILSIAFSTH